jgi:superfamily II DNA or RNA helicase
MLANLLCKLNTKVLIIANQKMLISQLEGEIYNVIGEKPTVLNSKSTQLGDINVATSQFIAQNKDVWYEIKEKIGLLVLDEAEALASPTVMRIFQRAPAKYRIMISATFTRSVDHRTEALLDFAGTKRIVLVNNKQLTPTIVNVRCPERFFPPMDTKQYARAKTKFFNTPTISYKALAIAKYSVSKNRQVLIACDLINKQVELRDALNEMKIPAECLNGNTSEKDRKRILEDYDKGLIKVILGLGVLNAGLSLPKISTIIRLSTPSSEEKLEQLIGRGRRIFDGKDGCFVIDLWFTGFKNQKRMQLYSLKERTESWKVHTITWDAFNEKYLKEEVK